MAELTFDDVKENSSSTMKNSIPEFKLSDGESAIVRIMHTSKESFKIYSVHRGKILTNKGKEFYPTINCLRKVGEDASACPICSAGKEDERSTSPTCYIHMVQYVFGTDGTMQPKAIVWGRNAIWVKSNLLPLIDEYGDKLPTIVCKITRTGSTFNNTKYSVTVCNQDKYPIAQYPMDAASAFDNYSELGTNIWDKSFDDLRIYVSTGSFPFNTVPAPSKEQQEANGYRIPTPEEIAAATAASGYHDGDLPFDSNPGFTPAPQQPVSEIPQNVMPQPTVSAPVSPAPQTTPWEQPDGNRPVRRYS